MQMIFRIQTQHNNNKKSVPTIYERFAHNNQQTK